MNGGEYTRDHMNAEKFEIRNKEKQKNKMER